MIHVWPIEPVGVAPQSAEKVANAATPMITTRRRPKTSDTRPPSANSAEIATRYPLTIHCAPVGVR